MVPKATIQLDATALYEHIIRYRMAQWSRDPLDMLEPLPKPALPGSTSRRVRQQYGQLKEATRLANRAIVGLKQLWRGTLSDELLGEVEWGRPRDVLEAVPIG